MPLLQKPVRVYTPTCFPASILPVIWHWSGCASCQWYSGSWWCSASLMVAVLQQTLILRHGDGCLMPFSCFVLLDNWQILVRGNTPMGGCLQRPLRRHAREPTLKWGKRVGLCYGSRQLIPLGYCRNTVEFHSGDDFRVALGRSSLSGLETPLGVLFDFLMSTVSAGMLTDPCNILYNRIIRWSRRRSANGRHFRSFRSCVTLTDPYWPHAQRAAFLCTFSMESEVEVEVEVVLGSKQAFRPLGDPLLMYIQSHLDTCTWYMYVKHKLRFYLAIIYLVDFPVIPGAGIRDMAFFFFFQCDSKWFDGFLSQYLTHAFSHTLIWHLLYAAVPEHPRGMPGVARASMAPKGN